MQLRKEPQAILPGTVKAKGGRMKYIIAGLVFVLLATGFWYFFFGRKPRVVMSIPAKESGRGYGCWAAGSGEVVLIAGSEVKLCDLSTRTEKWSVKLPSGPVVDVAKSGALDARFAKLQQWADELAVKRNALITQEATLQFNKEVAKYQAELVAARAAAAISAPPVQTAAPVAAPEVPDTVKAPSEPVHVDRPKPDTLNSAGRADAKLLEGRIQRRTAKIAAQASSIETKRAAAKTEFQRNAVKDEEKKMAALAAEQKADEAALEKIQPAPKPKAQEEEAQPVVEEEIHAFVSTDSIPAQAVPLGDVVWVVDGTHAVALERSSGDVKQDVPLAGYARKVLRGDACLFVVVQTGAGTSKVTRLAADTAPQSLYVMTGRNESAFLFKPNGDREANVQALRVEFGGQLVRADIKLIERKLKARDAVNPDTEKKLTQTISESAGNSTDELLAITKLMSNDAQRLMGGQGKELLDDSTYEVTLRKPFEPSAPLWTGRLRGRVQFISTPHLNFLTAGTQLLAFTPDNKKAWEATLGAPLPIRESDGDSDVAVPWLEAGDKLYFADGAFLTSFDIASGQVQWRLPGVGIRKLQTDVDGNLYVACDNLPTDSLFFTQDAASSLASPSVMKISAADGKILWQGDKYQDVWVSGKDVYVYRELVNGADLENAVFDPGKVPEARTKIYKLSRSSGKETWEWYQARRPRAVIPDHKYVALLFGDELQVIHSISL